MGLTPTTPNFGSVAKSFWSRREGKGGMVMIAMAVAVLAAITVLFGNTIAVFVKSTLDNIIYEILDVIAILALTSPVWSKRVRFYGGMAFKLAARWSTQILVETDPIGILREHSLELKKDGAVLDRAIEKVSKIIQRLSDTIDKLKSGIMDKKGMDAEADRQLTAKQAALAACKDPNQALRLRTDINSLQLRRNSFRSEAGMAVDSIKQEQELLDQNRAMYEKMLNYKNMHEYKVNEFDMSANMMEQRREAVLAGQEGLTVMQRLLGGDPVKMDLINRTVDYLNDEASDLKGALNNFDRWADKDLTDMSIQNGAASARGEDIFAQLEQKLTAPSILLQDGADTSIPINTVQDSTGAYVPVSAANDYSKFLK